MRHLPRRRQQGLATLVVVMALFFLVSLAAAYASRNLIFEQRTSANQYRATQALEAAEAGAEWTIALLNSGRIDDACQQSADPAAASFRGRYLQAAIAFNAPVPYVSYSSARWMETGGTAQDLAAACVRGAAGWSCSCPTSGEPAPAVPAGDGTAPAFRVTLGGGGGPGTILLKVVGCTSFNVDCLVNQNPTRGDARAVVNVLVAVAPAMPTGPAAAVTVKGDLTVASPLWRVVNADPGTNGVTVNTGGDFVRGPDEAEAENDYVQLQSVAGSSGGSARIGDRTLSNGGMTTERLFKTFLGVGEETFRRLPTTLEFSCGGSCGEGLRELVAANPGRPIWIPGDLAIDGDIAIGTPQAPALLVIGGNLNLASPDARIHGIVYVRGADVALSGSSQALIQGALIAAGNVSVAGGPAVVYDAEVVTRVRLTQGPVVRVPGGWRDF
jgi:Tfp pilus assembly protein PilX